jgi:BirA family biotin operon repressor/biotin-[acetyl-CoA-carboxylase] ligase
MRPTDPPAPSLALVAAVALHEVLCRLIRQDDERVLVKWPNDILAGGAKLAGILLERSGEAVVIGFGANLAHHPHDLDRPVTSIAALTGSSPAPADVADQLASAFAAWLSRWRQDGLEPIRQAWLTAAHPLGTRLSTPEGEGTFAGLDVTGALRLELPDGGIRLVHAGDVFLL